MQNLRRKNESGRSMVEMLGVLAIVGVLSVGGVYGYGVAMKKHKANELLHQASMLATTISAQAMTNDGKLPQTITSFGNSNYGTFSPSTTDALNGKGFSIEISNMDSAVCKQMEKMAGGMVQGASCSGTTLTLTYYKNLATNPTEGEKSPTGSESCDLTASDCPKGIDTENCVCQSTEGQTCTDHTTNECGLGYYCQFSPSDCVDRGDGVCTEIKGDKQTTGAVKHWVGPTLDWWSANSWCLGKGSSGLVSYSTMQKEYFCNKTSRTCDWEKFLNEIPVSGGVWLNENVYCTSWAADVSNEALTSGCESAVSFLFSPLCE